MHIFCQTSRFKNVKEVANSLIELRLSSYSCITSEVLIELSSVCKLEVLDLSDSWTISNSCLSYVSILSTLTSLSLADYNITDEGLAILGSQSSILTSLCLENCNSISEKGIHKLFHGEGQFGNGLVCLDIDYIPRISDAAIATISSSAKALTDLCLSASSATDAAVEMLASRGMSNDGSTPLRRLDLSSCIGLSDGLVGIFDKKAFFSGLHWLGICYTDLCSRQNEFEVICASRRWLTVCFDPCQLCCHNNWMCHCESVMLSLEK